MFVEGGGQFGQLHQMKHKNLKTMLLYTGLYNWVSSKFCACACTNGVSPCTQTSNSIMCFGRAPEKEQVVEAEKLYVHVLYYQKSRNFRCKNTHKLKYSVL